MVQKESRENKKRIFISELNNMVEKDYISNEEFTHINNIYEEYHTTLLIEEREEREKINQLKDSYGVKKTTETPKVKKEVIKKPKKTPEESREIKITWSLIMGVIMILISGLFVATTNWDTMGALSKSLSIGFVSILFFGFSFFSGKVLKIKKTSFAFLVLASLFLPIVFLSAGYFQLFGEWLSFKGEGRYLMAFLATIFCLPIYVKNAQTHQSRLFVWLSYLTGSLGLGFLLGSFYLPVDLFYFGIILFNGLLLFTYHKNKTKTQYKLFLKELPSFTQLNLIISTLLMITMFDNYIGYSFNIILTAILYMSMVFVYNSKHYHFVFTALLVYGIYQLVDNSFLQSIDILLYPLVGIIYVALQVQYKNDNYLKKAFQYTSGLISFFAFIYISIEGIFIRAEQPSLIMLCAYIIVSLNYLYLSHHTGKRLFSFLSPIFITVSGLQGWTLIEKYTKFDYFEIYLFSFATLMFFFIYYKDLSKWLKSISISTLMVSIFTMVITLLSALLNEKWITLSILLMAFSIISILINNKSAKLNMISAWATNLLFGLSFLSLYNYYANEISWYEDVLGFSFHLALVGVILLILNYLWKRYHENNHFHISAFTFGQIFYTLAILSLPATNLYSMNDLHTEIITPLILIGSIVVYTLLTIKTKIKHLYILVTTMTFISYLSFIPLWSFNNDSQLLLYLLSSVGFLLIISETVGKKYIVIKPYFSIFSHSVLPLITLITLFSYILYSFDTKEISSNLFLIPVMIYIFSSIQAKYEWSKKLFLYLLFTSLTLMVGINIHFYIPKIDNFVSVVFITTSILIFITWILSNKDVKDRIDYYFIPFLIITTMFINFNDTNISYITISSALTILSLFLLYRRKWSIFNIIPLLTHLPAFSNTTLDAKETLISMIVVSLILLVYGIKKHEYLISKTNLWFKYHIDWYSIMTIPYIIGIYGLSVYLTSINDYSMLIETMINSIAPVLFTTTIYLQINRVNKSITKKIFKTITALGFMTIYYSLIANIDFNKYIETEIYLLPWIILSILLSKKVWIGYEKVMKHIQTIILLLITITLVIDALNSNTLYDAIIVGTLSMISILSGMHFKIKSYFFVGIGVLLLNIMIQTRPLWGNTPWWVYLLLGGATLIGFASFYEWQKQKVNNNGENIIQSKKKKIIEKLKEWN